MTFDYSEYLLWLRIYVARERKCQTLKGNTTSVNSLFLSSQRSDFTQLGCRHLPPLTPPHPRMLEVKTANIKELPKVRTATLSSGTLHKHCISTDTHSNPLERQSRKQHICQKTPAPSLFFTHQMLATNTNKLKLISRYKSKTHTET